MCYRDIFLNIVQVGLSMFGLFIILFLSDLIIYGDMMCTLYLGMDVITVAPLKFNPK